MRIRAKGRKLIAWMGMALDATSRLWMAGVVSTRRDRDLADRLLHQVRACCQASHALLVCTDGWAAYVRRVGGSEIPVRHGRGREQEPLGQELTRRGNSKVDCSMLLKWKTREDMYLAVLRVLCAWGNRTIVEPQFPHDAVHIRHSMSNMATLEKAFGRGKCARSIHEPSWMERSLRRVAGNEPEREHKGT